MKSLASAFMVTLILVGTLIVAFDVRLVKTEPDTIMVPDDYPTIQDAVNAASGGDIIFVRNGTYYENVVVDKPVQITGQNKSTVIIDGEASGTVVVLAVDNATISGFTIRGSGFAECGILARGGGNNVSNNVVTENYYGIVVDGSTRNVIAGNEATFNSEFGIVVSGSSDNVLVENNASNSYFGIVLSRSVNNTLIANTMSDNEYNFGVWGEADAEYEHEIDTSNLVEGRSIYYLKRVSNAVYDASTNPSLIYLISSINVTVKDLALGNNVYSVFLWRTTNSTIQNVTITSNRESGMAIYHSSNNTLSGNRVSNSYYGILLQSSHAANIVNNSVFRNWDHGIFLRSSHNCTIAHNIAVDNDVRASASGIWLESSNGNWITSNTVESNINGIRVGGYNNTVTGNNASRNVGGIKVNGNTNRIIDNDASGNLYGITVNFCTDNTVSGNNISLSGRYGMFLASSQANRIFHNNLVNNTVQLWILTSANIWDNGYPEGGNYWSNYYGTDLRRGVYQNETGSDGIGDTPYVMDLENRDRFPLMIPYSGTHDLGIGASVSRSVIAEGYDVAVQINATIINYGLETETFNLSIHVHNMTIEQTIVLPPRNSTTFTCTWNTTGCLKASYPLAVFACPVSGETFVANNLFTCELCITIPGDVNGNREVNIFDMVLMAGAYSTKPPNPNYVPNCDIVGDGDIDIFDIVIAAGNYGESW